MRAYSVFDIMGPIMIGPSSSHTAGAARLGKVGRAIAGEGIKKVKFLLHGSFASTYKGHGTDRALVAGILGMKPWDERLRDSIKLAEEEGIDIEFIPTDLGDVHPNTVKMIITKENREEVIVRGSSIGGGNIIINEVNGENIEFTGEYPTIIINHEDVPGMVAKVTSVLYEEHVNIAFMKVYRAGRGEKASMVFEVDNDVTQNTIDKIRNIDNVLSVRMINILVEGE